MIFLGGRIIVACSWILLKSTVVERLFGYIRSMLPKIDIYRKHTDLKDQSYSCQNVSLACMFFYRGIRCFLFLSLKEYWTCHC